MTRDELLRLAGWAATGLVGLVLLLVCAFGGLR